MKPLRIGQIARLAGVGVETVRFYERKGLLEKPTRKYSGYRQYGEDAIVRLRVIKRAKELGFSLKEIKELLRIWRVRGATCEDVRPLVESKLAQVAEKIGQLESIRQALKRLVDTCPNDRLLSELPILKALEEK